MLVTDLVEDHDESNLHKCASACTHAPLSLQSVISFCGRQPWKQFTLYKDLGDVDMISVHIKLSGKTENGTNFFFDLRVFIKE